MSGRNSLGRVAVLAIAVLVMGGAAATPLTPAHEPGPSAIRSTGTYSINVTAVVDYGYQPDTLEQVPTNATIVVTFIDADTLPHSFTIWSRAGVVIPVTDTPSQLTQLLTTYPPLFSDLLNGSGEHFTGTFRSPVAPGWYEFVCNVSGHFQNGMYGFIAFGENLPSNLTTPSRTGVGVASSNPGLVVAIGVLVVIALAFGYVVWRQRRAAYRMPPPHPKNPPRTDRPRG